MSLNFEPNDDKYMFLSGADDDSIFLFIHGYGSSHQDLVPLAKHINSRGYNCSLLLLTGHGKKAEDMAGLKYADWLNQVREFYKHYKSLFKKIYIIGFSLGATLSLDIAKEENVNGVVAISTFLKPPKFTSVMLSIAKHLGLKYVPRFLQVTSEKTRKEIIYSKQFLVKETLDLIDTVSKIAPSLANIKCPVLFFHSTDDMVSDYWSTANLVNEIASYGTTIVTFRCLSHFLHFDAPLSSWFRVIADFFWHNSSMNLQNPDFMKDAWSHASEELKHWSGILFQLIVGFFSIFGSLIYFSLPDVLEGV